MIPAATTNQCTAIVGSGPAGLSCAYYLSVLKRNSVIFESDEQAGGLLATGIPEFRLPRAALSDRIARIVRGSVQIRLATPVTDDLTFAERGYSAVFIATGAQCGRKMGIPREDRGGVVDALAYLRSYCRKSSKVSASDRIAAVIGGGHTAFDAARAAVRDGARSVTVYYRRPIEELGAYQEEVEEAIREGVNIQQLSQPLDVLDSNGKVSGMLMGRTEMSPPDESGRQEVVVTTGSEFEVTCDLLIRAIGQQLPEAPLYAGYRRSRWGGLEVELETGVTAVDHIYAGGDCVLGASSVVRAIDSGKRTALAIDRYLQGTGALPPLEDRSIPRPFGLFNP